MSAFNGAAPARSEIADLTSAAESTSDLLRAMSHEHRLTILAIVCRRECSVGELERLLDLPQPAVSQQLARLRADNLVQTRRDGRTIYYCANVELLKQVVDQLTMLVDSRIALSADDADDDARVLPLKAI